jgi:hypothetical protein
MTTKKVRPFLIAANIFFLAFILIQERAYAGDSFICVADMSTGFRWNGTAWEIAKFNVAWKI